MFDLVLDAGVTRWHFILVAAIWLLVHRFHLRRRIPKGLCLPPGPPPKLIVGNVSDFPMRQEWVTFSQWAKTYGDLVYLNILGSPIVLINSTDVAYELFEKRSSIYSDRGDFPMIRDLMGWDWSVAIMRYGERWRRHRRVIRQKFHPIAAAEYKPVQIKRARSLLRRLYETPDNFAGHMQHTAGAIIMEVVYGIKVLPRGDPYIDMAEKAIAGTVIAGNPGAFLVDVLPVLKYVPAWFPGAGFKKKARLWREFAVEMNVAPFAAVKQALNAGTAKPSFTSSLLEEISVKGGVAPGQEEVIRNAGSTLFAAGADTTTISLLTFLFTMLLFPEAQKKAQEELDEVVGLGRLPEYEDRESLPYINALCKEVLRWHPVTPFGVPHRVTQDDVFGGYFIPAGSIVLGNTWTLLHDETIYGADTDKFKPERFLAPGVRDPTDAFGYGRRACPGRYFADNTLFMIVASILSVFKIAPSKDSNGNDHSTQAAFQSGFLSAPVPFTCTICPRSDTAKRLILQEIS
ncbi:cytochrome P450 [Gautieria morchelliformis]|nr:cytochrome P450 [Gautieria morchelliformis]